MRQKAEGSYAQHTVLRWDKQILVLPRRLDSYTRAGKSAEPARADPRGAGVKGCGYLLAIEGCATVSTVGRGAAKLPRRVQVPPYPSKACAFTSGPDPQDLLPVTGELDTLQGEFR